MPQQKQQWINIDEVINDYLDRSEQSIHKYWKMWHIAFDGMQQMGLDFFYTIRSVKLPVNPNRTVTLPDNYLQYSKIGVLNAVGEIIPMAYNNKLTKFADLSSQRLEKTQDNTIVDLLLFNTPIWYNYWNGDSYSALYGLPSGSPFIGSFKIDNANGIILLSENFGYDYIILEFVASPEVGGVYYIPVQFKMALLYFIAWQDIDFLPTTRRGNMGDKASRRKNYFNERRLGNARYRPIYLEEAVEWNMQSTRLAVKM
jgi:hypothetical protein